MSLAQHARSTRGEEGHLMEAATPSSLESGKAQVYRLGPDQTRLLSKGQMLYLDVEDQIVALMTGAPSGSVGLRACRLSPASLRAFVILLLVAPDTASYATLQAGLTCSEECLTTILINGTLTTSEFQTLVQEARGHLAPLGTKAFKRQLVPLRHALDRLEHSLVQKRFPWTLASHYKSGYLLVEVAS